MEVKNYLIIGASSGIGKTLAEKLSQTGHRVIGTYNKNKLKNNENITYHQLNILDENADWHFLPEKLHGLIYCPGSIELKPFKNITKSKFEDDYALQLIGAVSAIQAALPALKASGNASIVLFSTVAVQTGFNFHTLVAASKGAVEGFARSLAAELSPKIRVNCIAPSITDTPLAKQLLNSDVKKENNSKRHPLQRIGNTNDIASMAAFLLSDDAGWITGQIHRVDGGISTLRI